MCSVSECSEIYFIKSVRFTWSQAVYVCMEAGFVIMQLNHVTVLGIRVFFCCFFSTKKF